MDTLLEPFRYEFFRNGIAVATLAGALCGLVGVYVVLRGMNYVGHGLSHAIFGGAAACFAARRQLLRGRGDRGPRRRGADPADRAGGARSAPTPRSG